ncbi:hypothetical protein Hte_010454 [Hypoxylon texense]
MGKCHSYAIPPREAAESSEYLKRRIFHLGLAYSLPATKERQLAKLTMKFLAISALLAGAAQAIQFLNDIPVGAYYSPGTEFVLEWEPEDRTDTFQLTIASFLTTPIITNPGQSQFPEYDFKVEGIVLGEDVKFSDGSFTWLIEPIDGRTGDEYYYSFQASYATTTESPRAFHLQ